MSAKKSCIRAAASLAAICMLLPLSAAAVQRTFVSIAGSDSNTASNCSNAAPCRGFAAALTVTDSGGEIIVKDSGGYGPVTIAQSVSIIATDGVYAGISVASGDGVGIATAGVDVLLKGLTINSTGGNNGIYMTAGNSLTVEKCAIRNFSSGAGIFVAAAAKMRILDSQLLKNNYGVRMESGAQAVASGSRFVGSASYGLLVYGNGLTSAAEVSHSEVTDSTVIGFYAVGDSGGTGKLNVKDSVVSRNAVGVAAAVSGGTAQTTVSGSLVTGNSSYGLYSSGSGARLVASGNVITHNGTGLVQSSSSDLVSTGDNIVSDNTTAFSGTIGPLGKM